MSCRYWQQILGINLPQSELHVEGAGAVPCSIEVNTADPTHSLNQERSSSWRTQVQSDSRYHLAQQVCSLSSSMTSNNITFSVPTGSKLNGTVNGTAVNALHEWRNDSDIQVCGCVVCCRRDLMLPASIGVFSQSTSVVFGFNSDDLISSDSQGVLGAKLQNYDGVLNVLYSPSTHLLKTRIQIVAMPVANLIQLPVGQTIRSCV